MPDVEDDDYVEGPKCGGVDIRLVEGANAPDCANYDPGDRRRRSKRPSNLDGPLSDDSVSP